jgi:hypothetical protein
LKVYVIYLKEKKELYALTDDKKLFEKFLEQRNRKLFIAKKVNMSKEEFRSYKTSHSVLFLTNDILSSKGKDISIVTTRSESVELSDECDEIVNEAMYIMKDIVNHNIKKKYMKAIIKICQSVVKDSTIDINTLDLFMHINKSTFLKEVSDDD